LINAASAAIVVNNLDKLQEKDQETVYRVLIKRQHDVENPVAIEEELTKILPGKNLKPVWLPDTLYQVAQSYLDVEGMNNSLWGATKHTNTIPQLWKKLKQKGPEVLKEDEFKYFSYPNTFPELKKAYPLIVRDWARFNNRLTANLKLYKYDSDGPQVFLSNIIEFGEKFQQVNEARCKHIDFRVHNKHLRVNEAFLRHAIQVEEDAHKAGKLLLWRYSHPLPGNIPDSPFAMDTDLTQTLKFQLQYFEMIGDRFSYSARLLEGFFGDGRIDESPYFRGSAPACTFSFLANDVASKKLGHKIPNAFVYSLAIDPAKVKELQDKLYLFYPRETMPEHFGIYGSGESFHPSWMMEYEDKNCVESWLELMQSNALQVHYANGTFQTDYKNNPEALRLRKVYNQFYTTAKAQNVIPMSGATFAHPHPTVKKAPVAKVVAKPGPKIVTVDKMQATIPMKKINTGPNGAKENALKANITATALKAANAKPQIKPAVKAIANPVAKPIPVKIAQVKPVAKPLPAKVVAQLKAAPKPAPVNKPTQAKAAVKPTLGNGLQVKPAAKPVTAKVAAQVKPVAKQVPTKVVAQVKAAPKPAPVKMPAQAKAEVKPTIGNGVQVKPVAKPVAAKVAAQVKPVAKQVSTKVVAQVKAAPKLAPVKMPAQAKAVVKPTLGNGLQVKPAAKPVAAMGAAQVKPVAKQVPAKVAAQAKPAAKPAVKQGSSQPGGALIKANVSI